MYITLNPNHFGQLEYGVTRKMTKFPQNKQLTVSHPELRQKVFWTVLDSKVLASVFSEECVNPVQWGVIQSVQVGIQS